MDTVQKSKLKTVSFKILTRPNSTIQSILWGISYIIDDGFTGRSIPFWNSRWILLSELLSQGKDKQQTSTGKLPCLFCMAEHSCGIKGCALFEVSLLAFVSGKFSSPSCTAPVIMLCVSMPLACLYQLSGWCSLSCAPKEEPPKLSGFIIPEITEDLNLDDCGHKIKDLEAVSFLSKVLQFQAVLQAVTPRSHLCRTCSSLQVHTAFRTSCLTTVGTEQDRSPIICLVTKYHLMLKRFHFLINNTRCAF